MIENAPRAIALLAFLVVAWTLLLLKDTGRNLGPETYIGYFKDMDNAPTVKMSTTEGSKLRESHTAKRKAVIIFTTTRSGSTFLGEFFNQHSEIYYLFEPLHGIGHSKEETVARKTVMHDLLKCNYSRIPDIYLKSKDDKWIKCKSNICFADRMELLWRNSDLCVGKRPYCGVELFPPKTLEIICRQSLFTAIKTVASPDLSELEPILLDPELDLKVIQLVRDPRAVIPSVMKMLNFSSDRIVAVANSVCKFFVTNNEYTKKCILPCRRRNNTRACSKNVRDAWNGHFMRISHEYLSLFPFEALKAVYNFVGINYDLSVIEWLESNTGIKTAHPRRKKRSVLPKNFYSTKRNSSAIVNAWRLQQNFSTVSRMQKICQSAMKDLGYLIAKNEKHLKYIPTRLFDLKRALVLK